MSDKREDDENGAEFTNLKSTSTSTATDSDSSQEGLEDGTMDLIRRFFSKTLKLDSPDKEETVVDKVISELTFEGLLAHWREHGFKNIVTMVGAGISTSAGIPDFRSPGSGLYNNLKKYKLPHPTAIFDIDYFHKNPAPFFALAKELYPGCFTPTPAHFFVRLLHEKGLLVRHYTQNIDTLDRLAGLPDNKIIEAHGSFYTNHCIKCNKEYDMAWMKEQIFSDQLPTCEDVDCGGVVKPDIVFFGENLPASFYSSPEEDFKECDLLIIMGTSLEVQPFASLIQRPGPRCVRLLINRDAVGRSSFAPWMEYNERSLLYGKAKNVRDVAYLGDCDSGVWELVEALGWTEELQQLIDNNKEQANLENNIKEAAQPAPTKEPAQPSPTKEPAQPAPTKEAAQPSPTKEPAQPAPTKEAAQPALTKEAAHPASTKDAAQPAPTKEAAPPALTKEAAHPASTKDAAQPASTMEAAQAAANE